MDEEVTTDASEVPPPSPPVPPPGEPPKPPETEDEPIETTDDPGTPEVEADPQNRLTGFERRVKKLTSQKEAAEREAEYWRKHVTAPPPPAPAPADKKPVFSDYNDLELYTEAASQWTAAQAVREALAQRDRETGSRTVLERYQQRVEQFKAATPDFEQAFEDIEDVQLEPDLLQAVLEAEEGPAIAYHLAKNLPEVRRLNSLPPSQRLMALGRLEAQVSAGRPAPAPKKAVSAAPAALKTPNSTAAGKKALEDMSPAEFIEHRNKTVGRR
jgi:hypothetical protein